MRYSQSSRFDVDEPVGHSSSNPEFFQAIQKKTIPDQRRCGLLFIGGNDLRAMAVRQAQGSLRYDLRASYWSHTALVLDWTADAAAARGVEVTLDPHDPRDQVPERNGVTSFSLSRYFDEKRYPNLCFVAPMLPQKKGAADPKETIRNAALNPNRERLRYPMWDWLSVWARYTYAPTRTANPLTESIPWPGAALCEYAYEAAGLDLSPGATSPNACPELLWATLLYWHERLTAAAPDLRAFSVVRDVQGIPAQPLPGSLEREFAASPDPKRPRRPSGGKG